MQLITPGQALLILIDNGKPDSPQLTRLYRLYLSGIKSPADAKEFDALTNTPILSGYLITTAAEAINRDPTRRYFETHLGYHTASRPFAVLQAPSLSQYYHILLDSVYRHSMYSYSDYVNSVLSGELEDHEYGGCIDELSKGLFHASSRSDREIGIEIIRTMYLVMVNISNHYVKASTLDIYRQGDNYYAYSQRGRISRSSKDYVYSANRGILKSYMYTPESDVAHAPYITKGRIPDTCDAIYYEAWPRVNFSSLVHPFVTSISGTMLCQLRMMLYLHELGSFTLHAEAQLLEYVRFMVSAMVYSSGGHSLNEFIAPFQLKETAAAFAQTGLCKDMRHFTLDYLFYESNQPAFQKAMAETVAFNRVHLQREKVNQAIRGVDFKFFQLKAAQRKAEEKREVTPQSEKFSHYFRKLICN